MGKYKICPNCGEKNEPSSYQCISCGEDLFQVVITDDAFTEDESDSRSTASTEKLVKICDCGAVNPPNARKCISCGEDISDIYPEPIKSSSVEKSIKLIDVNGAELLKLNKGDIVIGRSNELENYLSDKTYVSNRHCRLFSEDGEFYIEDLNSTNSSFVNNKRINSITMLSDNDEIALGGIIINGEQQAKAAYFRVKIE